MRNPLRTEAEAFRFLIVVIGGAVVIGLCAWANEWLGVAAAVLVVGGIAWWLWRSPSAVGPKRPEPLASSTPLGHHRVLLLAPVGAEPGSVAERLRPRLDGRGAEVLVVVPALAATLEALTGAVDDRRGEAARAAETIAARLADSGVQARGTVGADEPMLAVEDALREFGADEVVLVEDGPLLERARERLAVPVSRLD
jgi:hypothetical protein